MMSVKQTRILVIGAGYAGMLATVRLAMKTRRRNVLITLINPRETFVERLRLHQYAANQEVKIRPILEILRGTGVQFVQAEVTALDADRREVVAVGQAGTQRMGYDNLLYAPGSTIDRDSIPGLSEHTYTLMPDGPRSAEGLRSVLPALNGRRGSLVVVGGGATGIEAAAEFAESYPGLRVSLVTPGELAEAWGGKIQSHIAKILARRGVAIREHTTIASVSRYEAITAGGEAIPFDACLWAGGFSVPTLARRSGLQVNARGQVLIDPFMRSVSHPQIYAAGDSAQPTEASGMTVRMAALTAVITGAHAADCLANEVNGRPQKPLSFAYIGQGIALGRHEAVGFNNFPDDKPKWPTFTGRLGFYGRELFVALLANLPSIERRLPGLRFWPGRKLPSPAARPDIGQEARPSGLSA